MINPNFFFNYFLHIFFSQIEGKVLEIAKLQEIFAEKVLEQVNSSYVLYKIFLEKIVMSLMM